MSAPAHPGSLHLRLACRVLRGGGVIACPTEAVWGLSCDPFDSDAVERLLALKGRPQAKGLILVAASQAQFEFVLKALDARDRDTLAASWPGPATWLVPCAGEVPARVRGEHDTVALRVSDHPVVRELCRRFGGPLVSTSANPAGARPARTPLQVRRYFGAALDYVLPGRLGGSDRPTAIRDLASGAVLRA